MEAWAILVVSGLAGLGCSSEAPRSSPAEPPPVVAPAVRLVADFDALLAYVPPEAIAVIAIDLEQARRSPTLTRAIERLLAELGQEASLPTDARALVIARVPARAGEPPADLLVVSARGEPRLVGPPAVIERARAAHLGASVTEAGELRDALAGARGGNAGFAAVRMTDALRITARAISPDLATATWFAGSLDVATGVTLTAIGSFPDLTTAVRVAATVDLGKSFALGELRSTHPVAARAIEKLFARPVGTTLRLTAAFDDAEAQALLALLR